MFSQAPTSTWKSSNPHQLNLSRMAPSDAAVPELMNCACGAISKRNTNRFFFSCVWLWFEFCSYWLQHSDYMKISPCQHKICPTVMTKYGQKPRVPMFAGQKTYVGFQLHPSRVVDPKGMWSHLRVPWVAVTTISSQPGAIGRSRYATRAARPDA